MSEIEDSQTIHEQRLDAYKVALVDTQYKQPPIKHKCAYCYLSSMTILMSLLGLFIMGSSLYMFVTNYLYFTFGSELFLMLSGAALFLVSLLMLISVCNFTNSFAKVTLFVFSIFSFSIFAISSSVTIYTGVYFNSNGLTNITEIDQILNQSIYYAYETCCNNTNTSDILTQVCYDVMGHNDTIVEKDCSSFYIFESSFMSYIHNVLILILTIGGITAVVNLISGVTSCCLMTAYKRVMYYKPNNQNEYIT